MPVSDVFDIDLESGDLTLEQIDKLAAKASKNLDKEIQKIDKANAKLKQTEQTLEDATVLNKLPPTGQAPTGTTGITKEEAKIRDKREKEDAALQKKLEAIKIKIEKSEAKKHEKIQKNIERTIEKLKKTREREDAKRQRNLDRLAEKVRKAKVKQFGHEKDSPFLSEIFGKKSAFNIMQMGRNPIAFFTGIAKAIPFLGGVFAAKEMADFIVDELIKIDKILKVFLDIAEERVNHARTLIEQALTSAGIQQRIITTSIGGADPREAFNTFDIFERNEAELEGSFAKSSNYGGG